MSISYQITIYPAIVIALSISRVTSMTASTSKKFSFVVVIELSFGLMATMEMDFIPMQFISVDDLICIFVMLEEGLFRRDASNGLALPAGLGGGPGAGAVDVVVVVDEKMELRIVLLKLTFE